MRWFWRLLLEEHGWGRIWTGLAMAIALAGGGLVYQQVQGNGDVSCAQTTPHIPDGPDGNGGCWPGPSNTGPDAAQGTMSAYTGSCTITTPNVTIDSKVIDCDITVGAGGGGLTISNSYLYGSVDNQDVAGRQFTIQDTYAKFTSGSLGSGFDCSDCSVQATDFTILRSEFEGGNRAAWCTEICHIEDSYLHPAGNLDPASGAHAGGVRQEHYATLFHNSIWCSYTEENPSNDETGCSADITGYPDFTFIYHNTFDNNLFMANGALGYCIYGGDTGGKPYSNDANNATYQVVTDNVFQKGSTGVCGAFGPTTDFNTGRTGNVWSNNKYDDGTTVNPA